MIQTQPSAYECNYNPNRDPSPNHNPNPNPNPNRSPKPVMAIPVCKNVIQRLNGTVNIESIPDEGTSIILKARGRMRVRVSARGSVMDN